MINYVGVGLWVGLVLGLGLGSKVVLWAVFEVFRLILLEAYERSQ